MCGDAGHGYASVVAKNYSEYDIISQLAAVETGGWTAAASHALFAASKEPVLIIDSSSQTIVEANPAASALCGIDRAVLVGLPVLDVFETASTPGLKCVMDIARSAEFFVDSASVRTRRGSNAVNVRLSSFRVDTERYWLMHLTGSLDARRSDCRENASSSVLQVLDAAPVAFLVTDSRFVVGYANRIFLKMVGGESQADLRGRPLTHWLTLSPSDLDVLGNQTCHRQATSRFRSQLRADRKAARAVDVCAVAVPDCPDLSWGFTIRELALLN